MQRLASRFAPAVFGPGSDLKTTSPQNRTA